MSVVQGTSAIHKIEYYPLLVPVSQCVAVLVNELCIQTTVEIRSRYSSKVAELSEERLSKRGYLHKPLPSLYDSSQLELIRIMLDLWAHLVNNATFHSCDITVSVLV